MKSIKRIKKEQFQLQKAVKFLIDCCLDRHGNQKISNPKPVVAHSLRVGFDLLKRGYNNDIVIAAILHDVNEDAGVPVAKIENRFGRKVAQMVDSASYNRNIPDSRERYLDTYKRIIKAGRGAIIVSVADHLDNADYYKYEKSKLTKKEVYEKWQIFLKTVASKISDEPIYQEFKQKMKNL
ncbi:MAG: HD domain-containing protein [Candidatus Paceibacterales bacterium]